MGVLNFFYFVFYSFANFVVFNSVLAVIIVNSLVNDFFYVDTYIFAENAYCDVK